MRNLAEGAPVLFRSVDGLTDDGKAKVGRLLPATFLRRVKDLSGTYAEVKIKATGASVKANPSHVHLATEHVEVLVSHPSNPWYRTECTCGHRGVWLKDYARCLPCPHRTNAGREAAQVRR